MQNIHAELSVKTPVIHVHGPDAGKFLQGQLTCDVLALTDGNRNLGAYCNIQGKIASLFWLEYKSAAYWLQLPAELVQPTITELKKYAVFSKVTLEIVEQDVPINDLAEIMANIPAVYPATKNEFFPHDINLPALGAVSFTKGCYRGQEIVARMQHRGNLKRGLYRFTIDKPEIKPGQIITVVPTNNKAGTVVRAYNPGSGATVGLAVVTQQLAAQPLSIDGSPLVLTKD